MRQLLRVLAAATVGLFCSRVAAAAGTAETLVPSVSIKPAPALSDAELMVAPTENWLTNGGTFFNQRYSPLAQINRDNVKQLKADWRIHLNGSGNGPQYSAQAQPLVYNGVLYLVTGADDVFAIDVPTGKILWTYEAKLDPARVRVCCGWMSRGLGMGDGKIYVGQLDAKLVALDQRTGKIVWSIQAENPLEGISITGAPLYVDGLIVTGFVGGDMGMRGRVKAYDAKNGKLRWTFYTIPAPGEFGSETWPKDGEAWKFGGAAVWQTPAYDPALGLLYFSTGNAGPDYNGAARAGDNLFTVSMLAIDLKTGKRRWHFQQVHHDIWDYDSPNPVILFDAPYNGTVRHGIAEVSKTGWVYILDRATGKPLIGIEERPVPQEPRQATSATQPYPVGDAVVPQDVDIEPEGFPLLNGGRIFTPFWDKIVVYKPQMAVNWPPSSYDPESNFFYFCGIDNLASSFVDLKSPDRPQFQSMWMRGGGALTGVAGRGVFGAIDLKTNRLAWRQQWKETCWSGSTVTAGGLVFVGHSSGLFTALDKADGTKLWQFQTDAGVNSTATTFTYRGQQHVAVYSGGTLFGGGKKGDSVWLFSLSGALESLPIQTPASPFAAVEDAAVSMAPGPADPANGKRIFRSFCVACHGDTGLGSHGGAPLQNAARDPRYIVTTASRGRNDMPAFKAILKPEELRDVAGYISTELFAPAEVK
jgi:quinohemoprotein ethanol dehydrogenase